MTPLTAPAPSSTLPTQRDPDLWHIFFSHSPDRALCGRTLRSTREPVAVDAPVPTCVVCEELSAAHDAGRWTP